MMDSWELGIKIRFLERRIAEKDKEIERLTDIQGLFISFMKRRAAADNFSEWDIICQQYPYLKALEKQNEQD